MTSSDLTAYVNILQGTASRMLYSNGNTLPLMASPFGMNHWSVQSDEGPWFFHPDSSTFRGLRLTHQPSPWMGDYGHLSLLPQTGEHYVDFQDNFSYYRREEAVFAPYRLEAFLSRYQTHLSFTPTERCGVLRMAFPRNISKRLLLRLFEGAGRIDIDAEKGQIRGFTRSHSGGVPENFAFYFIMEFNASLLAEKSGVMIDGELCAGRHQAEGEALGAAVEFSPETGGVEVRIGSSFINLDQAQINMTQELGDKSFDEVCESTRQAWEAMLGRIELQGNESADVKACFYSALYRCLLYPRKFHEIAGEAGMKHYSVYDGEIHDGPACTDNGFWDTYRTIYSLFALAYPDVLEETLAGWINAYKEGGWFPKWASPGYRACMIGTHIDAVFADACAKGVTFDLETAYEGLRKNAFHEGDREGHYGRVGLAAYQELGYVPADEVKESASRTMDAAYNDWCLAQLADALGRSDDYQILMARSRNYRNIFDCQTGFMRGRNRDGSWFQPFTPIRWGSPYVEGSVWQCGWAVQHDPQGLIELMGGPEAAIEKFEQLVNTPPAYDVGYYRQQIHEMAEMAAVDFGQYAHSNQPSHHLLYFFALAGAPEKTQYWLRRVMQELYWATPDGLAGDEDNGEMSAWYVLNALGVYPFCPGSDDFLLGSPMVEKAVLHLNDAALEVTALGNTPQTPYVQSATFNDETLQRSVSCRALKQGGRLQFNLKEATL